MDRITNNLLTALASELGIAVGGVASYAWKNEKNSGGEGYSLVTSRRMERVLYGRTKRELALKIEGAIAGAKAVPGAWDH